MTQSQDKQHSREIPDTLQGSNADLSDSHKILLPRILRILDANAQSNSRILDLGCGTGVIAGALCRKGYSVTGIDPDENSITAAKAHFTGIDFRIGSGYDNLCESIGTFKAITCIEVIEHIYDPRKFLRSIYSALEDGGIAIISTPYHGYLKNLAISLLGMWDWHFTALWDNGHIKFWSQKTLGNILKESGFKVIDFYRVGRIPPFAKSLIVVMTK